MFLLAVHREMSHSAQWIIYFIAFIAFVVAGAYAWFVKKDIWGTLISVGLACFALVLFWNQLALS